MQARYLVVKLGQLGSTVCFVVSGLPRLGAPGEWGWRWLRASVLSSIWKPPGVPGNGPGVWHSTATRSLCGTRSWTTSGLFNFFCSSRPDIHPHRLAVHTLSPVYFGTNV